MAKKKKKKRKSMLVPHPKPKPNDALKRNMLPALDTIASVALTPVSPPVAAGYFTARAGRSAIQAFSDKMRNDKDNAQRKARRSLSGKSPSLKPTKKKKKGRKKK